MAASVAAGPAPPPERGRFTLEAGGLALGSFAGMPPAVLPLVRVALAPADRWPILFRLTAAGLGTRARVSDAQGAAEVAHQLALAEVVWAFRAGHRLQPFVSLGAGAVHVTAEGTAIAAAAAVPPSIGRTEAAWAFLADAGAGLRLNLGRRLQLAGELHAQADAPSPSVHYLGSQLAVEGRPTWVTSLTMGLRL